MLRKSEKPKDKGQQMILNSYQTICQIKRNAGSNFSVRQLLDIHRSMTENTLDEENDAGRIRQHDNILIMDGITGDVAHTPPHHEELPNLLADLETFSTKTEKHLYIP